MHKSLPLVQINLRHPHNVRALLLPWPDDRCPTRPLPHSFPSLSFNSLLHLAQRRQTLPTHSFNPHSFTNPPVSLPFPPLCPTTLSILDPSLESITVHHLSNIHRARSCGGDTRNSSSLVKDYCRLGRECCWLGADTDGRVSAPSSSQHKTRVLFF